MERSVDRTPWDDDCPLSLSPFILFVPLIFPASPRLSLPCPRRLPLPLPSPSFTASSCTVRGANAMLVSRNREPQTSCDRVLQRLAPLPGISSKMVFKLNSFLLENIDLCFGNYAETGIRYFEYIPSYIPSYTVS